MVEVGYGEMLSWWCWLWDHSSSGHSDIYILTSSKWSHLTVVRSHSFQLQACFLEHRCKNHKQLSSSKVSHQCACACGISRGHTPFGFSATPSCLVPRPFFDTHTKWSGHETVKVILMAVLIIVLTEGSGQGEVREFCIVGAGPGGTQYDNKKILAWMCAPLMQYT